MLAAEPAVWHAAPPAAELVTEYTSGSFSEFLTEDVEAPASPVLADPVIPDPVAAGPPAADPVAAGPLAADPVASGPVAAGPLAADPVVAGSLAVGPVVTDRSAAGRVAVQPADPGERAGDGDDDAPTLTNVAASDVTAVPEAALSRPGTAPSGPTHAVSPARLRGAFGRRLPSSLVPRSSVQAAPRPSSSLPPAPRHGRKRRSRRLPVALSIAVLLAAGIAGGFTLQHHHAGPGRASASPSHGTKATAPSAAASAGSSPLTPAVVAGQWTAPTPLDQQAAKIGNPTITGVSCPQPAVCYAVDSVGAIMSSTAAGSWKTVSTDTQAGLVSISCASTIFCLALDSAGGAVTLSQGSWSSPSYIDSRTGTFTSVSCPTSTFCMTVDSGGNAFAYTGSATGWQPFTVDPGGMGLASVSCTSAAYCVAVGDAGDIFTYDGTSWSAGQAVDSGNQFAAVSCSTPAFCVAVDHSGNAAVFTGSRWTVATIGATAGAIACPSDGYCVAVDSSGGALVYRHAGWSSVTTIDGANAVQALSCPAVAVCTATDSMGNVMYYAPSQSAGSPSPAST